MGAMPAEFGLFIAIAIGVNLALVVATLRLIGGGNFLRAMGSQVLTIPNRRIPRRGILGGVVAGLAYKNRWPLGRARAITFAIWFFSAGFGAVHYLVLCRYLPAEETAPWDFDERTGSAAKKSIEPQGKGAGR
jgi:phage shock protein PspC (stress-responsive transcriptional regulator)